VSHMSDLSYVVKQVGKLDKGRLVGQYAVCNSLGNIACTEYVEFTSTGCTEPARQSSTMHVP